MKETLIIVLLWVTAALLVGSWNKAIQSVAEYEVDRTNPKYQDLIDREGWK